MSSPLKGSLGQVKVMETGSLLVQKGRNHHTHIGSSLDGAELVKLAKEETAKQIAGQSLGQRKAACLGLTEGCSTPLESPGRLQARRACRAEMWESFYPSSLGF